MRRNLLLLTVLCGSLSLGAQELSQVVLSSGQLHGFSFITNQGIIIRVSDQGQIVEWGTEQNTRYGYFPGQLEQYMGRVDYFGTEADSISRGKIKSIGTCMFSYFGAYEQEYKIGKLKSVGSVQLDYFNQYENAAYRGKLKSAGRFMFTYYSTIDDESSRGKLKAVNNTPITYYSIFDDKYKKGQVKSIGNYGYGAYTQFEKRDPSKQPGMYAQNINGITYLVR